MTICTAEQIYQRLIDQRIKDAEGKVTIEFMDITTLIQEPSAMGDLFQEWLGSWFIVNNIEVEANTHTQEAPDFYIFPQDKQKGKYPIKVQAKRQMIYNIRPISWMATQSTYKPFNGKESFLRALNQTLIGYQKTSIQTREW